LVGKFFGFDLECCLIYVLKGGIDRWTLLGLEAIETQTSTGLLENNQKKYRQIQDSFISNIFFILKIVLGIISSFFHQY